MILYNSVQLAVNDYMSQQLIIILLFDILLGRTLWELYSAEMFVLNRAWTVKKSITRDEFKVTYCLLSTIQEKESYCFDVRVRAKKNT